MNKTATFDFAAIIKRAAMLSAFEAKQAVNTNGESMFADVRIYSKDNEAITAYIREGAEMLEAMLATTFTIDVTDDATPTTPATKITWTFTDLDPRRTDINADKFTEAIVCYTLSRWLDNKIPKTAQAYTAMFKDLSEAAVKITKTKKKPQRPAES